MLFFLNVEKGFSQSQSITEKWKIDFKNIVQSQKDLDSKIHLLENLMNSYEVERGSMDGLYAEMLHRLGNFYVIKGDYEKGIGFTKQAVTINRNSRSKLRNESFLANSYFNLGTYYGSLQLNQEFNLYMDSCISIAKKFPKKAFIGTNAFERKAAYYFQIGDNYTSIEIANQGLNFAKHYPLDKYVALVHLQNAQSLLTLDKVEEADKSIEEAFEILPQVNITDNDVAIAYSIKALSLKKRGDVENAINYYKLAIEANLKNGDVTNAISNLSNIGNLYDDDVADPHKAIESYSKGLEILEKINDPILFATVQNNIGTVYTKNEKYADALKCYQTGLINFSIGFKDNEWKNNPSLEQIKTAKNHLILISILTNKGETLLNQYQMEADSSYLSYALECFKLTDKSVDLMRWNQTNEQTKYFWREQTKKMYEKAIETCFQLQDMENALYFFEKSRAVMLNDKLSELGSRQYLSLEDQALEREFKVRTVSLHQKIDNTDTEDQTYQNLLNERYQIKESYDKFIKSLESKYPSYYRYKYDTAFLNIADLRSKVLQKDQTFISYFNGSKHLYALTIDASTATISKINKEDYEKNATELAALSGEKAKLNQDYSRYMELAHSLYTQIFQPLNVKTKRVVISPDDHFIPFDLLIRDKDQTKSFLLHDHAFSYTYSAGYLLKNKTGGSIPSPSLLAIAPVNYQPHLQQATLQGADLSLNALKNYFSSSLTFVQDKATKKEFIKNLSQYSIAHLYSHASADETEPTIYFYDSALLVSDLQLLDNLTTRLVVLSACNTGVGKNIKGEGVFSLSRGFAAAGIPSSITSLWQIDNHSTYQINELFYKYLSRGLPLDVALQEAKLELLREQDKSYDLPYFWAGSILLGNSEGFLAEEDNGFFSIPTILGVMLVVLLVLSSLVYHRRFWRIKFMI